MQDQFDPGGFKLALLGGGHGGWYNYTALKYSLQTEPAPVLETASAHSLVHPYTHAPAHAPAPALETILTRSTKRLHS